MFTRIRSVRGRLAGLTVVSVLTALISAVIPATTAHAFSCADTQARVYLNDYQSGGATAHWVAWSHPPPPANGLTFRNPSNPVPDTITVTPFEYLEFGGDGLTNRLDSRGQPILPAIYVNPTGVFLPARFLTRPNSNCVVGAFDNGFLMNPMAPAGVYHIYSSQVCALYNPDTGVNCNSIIGIPMVNLNYVNRLSGQDPNASIFMPQVH